MPRLRDPSKILGTVLGLRLTDAEVERLDEIVARVGVVTRHQLCRWALFHGLAAIERDPRVLMTEPGGRPKRSATKAPSRRARTGAA